VLFNPNHIVDYIPIWYGQKSYVKIGFDKGITLTLKRLNPKEIQLQFDYHTTLKAPLKKGDEVGKVTIQIPGQAQPIIGPVMIMEDVDSTGFFGRMYDSLVHLLGGRSYSDKYKNITPFEQKNPTS